MANAQVCDPCLQDDGVLTAGELIDWKLGNVNGEIVLCEAHYANYVAGFTAPTVETPTNGTSEHVCPECGREFSRVQGLSLHRKAKQH